ncbi:hypothetical protein Pyn_41225 [Prunus yedoensis var. nudiflora]|uniref:Uncharacterized protein n=1 Tax=Prunus yedoensis var. nudiflora TaxID=2094558 RepID=A0A314V162_PRUYE|nr:hypothetical protein Pyn_41225 [Prunus yedoensis var. nudiflora]
MEKKLFSSLELLELEESCGSDFHQLMSRSGDSSQGGLNVDLGDGLEGDGSASGTGMLGTIEFCPEQQPLIHVFKDAEMQENFKGLVEDECPDNLKARRRA